MHEWHKQIQEIVEEIDICIKQKNDEALTLAVLAEKLGYSEYYVSRKFKEVSGMNLREYMRQRLLAFALKEVRDTKRGLLDIGGTGMENTANEVKTYFVTIPAHKYLHIRNYESIGYWDFWQKQSLIPGRDCETICGLLDSIPGKLDDDGGDEADSGSGQVMAFINEPEGRICSWGIPLAESYGVRLPCDYAGEVPEQMQLMDVEEGTYIVFEHGPFDFETQNQSVEQKIEEAMKNFDYSASGYELDKTQGRVFYFYHDCKHFWKYVRPVKKSV